MASATATIRVPRETRDVLAAQARRRGVSLAAMLAEVANAAERDAIFAAERVATRADGGDAGVLSEERDWEAALDDALG